MANFAVAYSKLGKYTEAEELEMQVLQIRKRNLGEENPNTILAKANLASTYRNPGKHTEAEKLKIQLFHARKKILGEEHTDTILATEKLQL